MVDGRGFTLIELMITIAILALLLAVGVPFTQRWGQSARVQQVESTLKQGFAHAKAVALRNPTGATTGSAAVLRLEGDDLVVCEGAVTCTTANAVWRGSKPTSTTISLNGLATTGGLGFSNQGMATASSYTVSDGDETSDEISDNGDETQKTLH
ncbi:prepilin-type N-terminal cleavage/methylation domain-containing protein [Jeongeupia sp. USM3]|uniref:prepilin-type N-terminal cleavage/methylation domain-containing protein n=1 Tax=Jeongeupia sp. USM3 TaxID=1906741 RepID=UPI00089DFC01|nr:prepilin-type N-terminal cleavage/methylation domain-containing protein [Jeongeupia sp. USM3]AOY00669.1 hypothetical protein BJP62_09625 [Jeongeupia sp. USM3]